MDVVHARVENTLELYERVHILSDKAYRHGDRDLFEAVGNVVASYQDKSLYGEKLTVNSATGEINVYGNIRYIAAGATLYGSEMYFNGKSGEYTVKNARIHAGNFVILGKQLSRLPDKTIFGEDAEYTTCLDCPESWVIQGKEVRVTMGEYITIKHALMKVKGVAIMYIPYIVFPIKKNRETGLLFPKFSLDLNEGFTYQQPFFWAIGDYNDMTVTPSFWGDRGKGTEFQYRHNLGERRWFEVNHLGSVDQLYQLNSSTDRTDGQNIYRHFSSYEHHFNFTRNFAHHLRFDMVKDLDIMRDYQEFTGTRVHGSELGFNGFFDYRADIFDVNIEASQMRNMLYFDASAFDRSFVQVSPEVNFSLMPLTLYHSQYPLISDISFAMDARAVRFRQRSVNEDDYIRNADRYHVSPSVDWNLGTFGPVNLKTTGTMDYFRYYFPNEDERAFYKHNTRLVSEMSFGVEKIFGVAYQQQVKAKDVSLTNHQQDYGLVGSIPAYTESNIKRHEETSFNSYRHRQDFKLKHHYSFTEKTRGNERFYQQIDQDSGLFDYFDALKENEHNLSNATFKQEIPVADTLEVQWNNSLVRKSHRGESPFLDGRLLRDNFDYDKIAYFNVSQGYDMSSGGENVERLTRLFVDSGITLNRTSLSASEYYFYEGSAHIFTMGASQRFDQFVSSLNYRYNNASRPLESSIILGLEVTPLDVITGYFRYSYDLAQNSLTDRFIGVNFRPSNKCWTLNLGQKRNEIDTQYSFHFEINFNDKNFNTIDLL